MSIKKNNETENIRNDKGLLDNINRYLKSQCTINKETYSDKNKTCSRFIDCFECWENGLIKDMEEK